MEWKNESPTKKVSGVKKRGRKSRTSYEIPGVTSASSGILPSGKSRTKIQTKKIKKKGGE